MFGAKWLKAVGRPAGPPVPPGSAATATPTPPPVEIAAASVAAPEIAAEPAPTDAAPATATGDAVRRASRMVEVTRTRSSRLGQDVKAALARHERWHRPATAAALALAIGGLGYAAGRGAGPSSDAAARLALVTADMHESRAETARLAAELRGVRTSVDGIRTERDKSSNRQSQLTEKVDRSATDAAGKMGKLAEQLERIEKAQRDPARLAPLLERLDRLERGMQVAAAPTVAPPSPTATPNGTAPTPPPKPAAGLDVTTTGSLADGKPDVRRQPVDGYVLRDIDDGLALIESRNGRYFEVSPGMNVPGLGRVEAIERRGRQWVVVTSKGVIGER